MPCYAKVGIKNFMRRSTGVDWNKIKVLAVCIFASYLAGIIGSAFTTEGIRSGWYETIKPEIAPPNYVFPIVWNILYILIGISLYYAWGSAGKGEKKIVAALYGANLFLNALWSYFFFAIRELFIALIVLGLIWASILGIMIFMWRINKKATYLMLPYFLWVSFAGILNYLAFKNSLLLTL